MIKTHDHTQSVASATWTITHNMGMKPVVDCVIDNGGVMTKIHPSSVTHTSDNVLTITFTSARSGTARLVGVGPFVL